MTYKKIALTISPKPRFGSALFHFYSDKDQIRKALNKCSDRYILYPEFDDGDRLHYHGCVIIKDPIKWYKSVKRDLQAFVGYIKTKRIKTHKLHVGWLLYSSKDWGYNQQIFEDPILPRTVRRRKMLIKLWNEPKATSEQRSHGRRASPSSREVGIGGLTPPRKKMQRELSCRKRSAEK